MNLKKWLAGALSALMLLAPVFPQPTYADTTMLELQILQQAHASAPAENISVPETVQKEAAAVKKEALPEITAAQSAEVVLTDTDEKVYITLNTETPVNITTGEERIYLYFIPEYSTQYTFYSTGSKDTYGELYDADMNYLTSNDDGGEGRNFSITCSLEAGVTYIYGVWYYSSSDTGTIPVHLEMHHNYQENIIKAPTCTEAGEIEYTCVICGESHTEIINPRHSWTEDEVCSVCGTDWYVEGTCGENLTWVLTKNGVLTISGTGAMADYTYSSDVPWKNYTSDITSVEIEDGVTSIGDWAFSACHSLTSITFAGNAPEIDICSFADVTATVYYPLGDDTWTEEVRQDYCGELTWVAACMDHNYEKGICTICGAKDPDYVPAVIASGWSGNTTWTLNEWGILTFTGSGNMRNYGYNRNQPWISYADQITSVVVDNGVTAIGTGAFMDLTKLESVTLPTSGLKKIGQAAFYGCTSLKEITIPDGVYTIWEYTFKNCTSLAKIRFPETLIKIDQGAFENCTALTQITLPKDTGIIGAWSFKGCTDLEKADMSASAATEIRAGAFKNCTALTNILLPKNIQKLGDSCFYGIGATSFTVPSTVTAIEAWCFARAKLTSIIFEGNAPIIGEGAFNKITLTATYDESDPSWTTEIMQNYGGTVTWTSVGNSTQRPLTEGKWVRTVWNGAHVDVYELTFDLGTGIILYHGYQTGDGDSFVYTENENTVVIQYYNAAVEMQRIDNDTLRIEKITSETGAETATWWSGPIGGLFHWEQND